jgi:hypothetical protein
MNGYTNFIGSFSPNIAEVVKASGGSIVSSPPLTNANAGRTVLSGSPLIPVYGLSPQGIDGFFDGSSKKPGLLQSGVSRLNSRVVKEDLLDWPA